MSLVSKIMSILKLDEKGQVEKFFAREIKRFTNAVRALEQNRKAIVFAFESEKEEILSKLEDAKGYVEDAYAAVELDALKNNDSMESFSDRYWENISRKEKAIELIEKQLEKLTISHKDKMEELDVQVGKYNNRIAKIK